MSVGTTEVYKDELGDYGDVRKQVRDTDFNIDLEITDTGFDGVEDTDWVNAENHNADAFTPTTGTIPVVISGAETVFFSIIDIVEGSEITIDWDDGSTDTYYFADNGASKNHSYAEAGSYDVEISDAGNIKEVDFRDVKLRFNSSFFKSCGDNLESISLYHTLTTPIINSADMAHLKLSSQLYLSFPQAGTYAIDSSDFAGYTLSSQLYLYFPEAGTYVIDSSDFASYTLSYQLYLYFNTTSLTKTIVAADFNGFVRLPNVRIEMGLTETEVNNILLGFYGAFPSKTNTGGTIDLAGNGNAAPSGTYQARCPPTTGKEAAYELLNDTCGVSSYHWDSIFVEGGL